MEHENTLGMHSTLITQLQNQLNEGQRSVGERLIRIKCYEREIKSLMREIKLREEFTQQQKERNDFLANENQRLAEQLDIIKEENLVLDNELNITQQLQIRKKDDLEKAKLKYSDIFEKWALSQRNIKEYFLKEEEGYLQIVELKKQKESLQDKLANVMLDAEKAEKKYEDTKANVDKIVEYNKLIANNESLRKQHEELCAEWLKLAQIQEIRKTQAVEKEKNNAIAARPEELKITSQTNTASAAQGKNIDHSLKSLQDNLEIEKQVNQSSQIDDYKSPACSGASLGKAKPGDDIKILENVTVTTKRKSTVESGRQSNGKLFKIGHSVEKDSYQFFDAKDQLSNEFPDFLDFPENASSASSPSSAKEENNKKTKNFFAFDF